MPKSKARLPVTPAVRALRRHRVEYRGFLFDYQPHGGARQGAAELGVEPHRLVKTLIFEDAAKQPLMVLMHGDREVSAKTLARLLGRKSIALCAPAVATRHSGYLPGGTSPFGIRSELPVYLQRSILELDTLYINGGKRGFMLELRSAELYRLLQPVLVDVAVPNP